MYKILHRIFYKDQLILCNWLQSLSNDDERVTKYLQYNLSISGMEFQQTQRVVQEARWIVTLKNAIDLNLKFAVAKLLYYGSKYHNGDWNAFDSYVRWADTTNLPLVATKNMILQVRNVFFSNEHRDSLSPPFVNPFFLQ